LPALFSHVGLLDMRTASSEELVNILKQDYVARKKTQPRFSLRAYSARIGIDQSLLTKILSGKRSLSIAAQQKVAKFLGFMPDGDKDANRFQLVGATDQFALLADWVHFALLEYLTLDNRPPSTKKLARKLGLEAPRVEAAIALLKRMGYIEITKERVRVLRPNNSWFRADVTSVAQKMYQKTLADLSSQAIDEVPFERRDHSSLTLALDPRLLPQLRLMLQTFRRDVDAFVNKNSKIKTSVYQMTMGLFPAFQQGENICEE